MNIKSFAVPYEDDRRMLYAKEYLVQHGFIYTDMIDKADFALLPVPAKKDMFRKINGKLAFYGKGDYENGYDYMKNETYVLKNAFLTAEGALVCLEENTPESLIGKNITIIGYGRIAKAMHKLLRALGAVVTVCSRSSSSKAEAIFNGAVHIGFDDLRKPNNADIIINTVPHTVLTKDELKALKKGVIILDLASFPGGVDTLVAGSLGIKLLNGRGMPSRYTEKTAGELIGEAVINIIEEEQL